MKKCPVCGVEHSDIVPVCSICGSSLENAEIIPSAGETAPAAAPNSAPAPAAPEKTDAPKQEAPKTPDFFQEDIQAAVSSVVSSAVDQGKHSGDGPAEIDPFNDDSPFVENVMKERMNQKAAAGEKPAPKKAPAPKKQETAAKPGPEKKPARKPAPKKPAAKRPEPGKKETQPKPADPFIDTTAVAAASAQKVQEAKQNAVAARERNTQGEEQKPDSFDWSERKHKRNQPKTNTPVIAAVCALLALLIIAMVFLLGKMITGDGNDAQQPGDTNPPAAGDTADPGSEDQQPGDDASGENGTTPEDGTVPEDDTTLPENDPNAEDQTGDNTDPDAAAQENQDGQEGQDSQEQEGQPDGETPADAQQPEDGDASGETQEQTEKPELPAITEADETVYATSSVRVRDYPSTQYGEVINALSAGQSVKRTGTTSTGWSRVKIGDTVGYVSSNYLSTTKPSSDAGDSSDSSTTAYATTGVNVRETPNGTVIGTLTQGQKVTLTGKQEGGWVQIKTDSLTGYVYKTYLSASKDGGSDNDTKDDVKLTETNDTVYATAGVNVRDYPSASTGKVVATLSKGQKVTRIGKTSNGWSKIKTGSVTGYVSNSYLSTSQDGGDDGGSGGSKTSGYILPESNTKNYTKSELSSLSKSDLRLARNEIYARHGRKFNDKSLQDYFNGRSWYSGTVDPATFDANINSYLNSYELANLKLIKELEG